MWIALIQDHAQLPDGIEKEKVSIENILNIVKPVSITKHILKKLKLKDQSPKHLGNFITYPLD